MSEEFDHSALQKSIKKIGQLYPILVNEKGEILDGNNRVKDNTNPEKKTVPTKNRYEDLMIRGNAHYRRKVPMEETRRLIIEMAKEAEKLGTPKDEVAKQLFEDLPYSQGYIMMLLPTEYKQFMKVQAGRASGEARSVQIVEHTVKTSDMVQCERDHTFTSDPRRWHGHVLCAECEKKAILNPEAYDGYFQYLKKGKKIIEKQKTKPVESKVKESWEFRQGQMKVQHSKIELKIVNKLRAKGYTVETDIPIVVKEVATIPDFILFMVNQKKIYGYVDGETTHKGKLDRDADLRDLLHKRFPEDVIVAVWVKGDSDMEADEKVAEIEEAMK